MIITVIVGYNLIVYGSVIPSSSLDPLRPAANWPHRGTSTADCPGHACSRQGVSRTIVRDTTIAQNAVEVGSRVVIGTPKSHKCRTVPVPAFVVERLAAQCEGKEREDLLFTGPAGFMRPPRGTGGWFANAVARANAPTVESYLLADGETKRYRVRYRAPERPESEIEKRGFATKAEA